MRPQVSREELESAVKQSVSIAGVLRALGIEPVSGRYPWIKKLIVLYDIDTSNLLGCGWSKDSVRYSTDKTFAEGSTINRSHIRKLIIRDNLIPYECAFCGNKGEWMGKPMALELDHINGVCNDHRLENLRFLCPNCHATTDTYCGKNKEKPDTETVIAENDKHVIKRNKKQKPCPQCGAPINIESTLCSKCHHKTLQRVKDECMPSKYELARSIVENGFSATGRMYDVSSQAIHKWCKRYGIPWKINELKSWYDEQNE